MPHLSTKNFGALSKSDFFQYCESNIGLFSIFFKICDSKVYRSSYYHDRNFWLFLRRLQSDNYYYRDGWMGENFKGSNREKRTIR